MLCTDCDTSPVPFFFFLFEILQHARENSVFFFSGLPSPNFFAPIIEESKQRFMTSLTTILLDSLWNPFPSDCNWPNLPTYRFIETVENTSIPNLRTTLKRHTPPEENYSSEKIRWNICTNLIFRWSQYWTKELFTIFATLFNEFPIEILRLAAWWVDTAHKSLHFWRCEK